MNHIKAISTMILGLLICFIPYFLAKVLVVPVIEVYMVFVITILLSLLFVLVVSGILSLYLCLIKYFSKNQY